MKYKARESITSNVFTKQTGVALKLNFGAKNWLEHNISESLRLTNHMKRDCTFAACDIKLWSIRWSNSVDIKKRDFLDDIFARVHRYLHSILFFVSIVPFWSCFYCEEYRNCAHTAVAAIIRDMTSVLMVWGGLKYSDIPGICPPELYFRHFKAAFIQSCRMHEYRKGGKSEIFLCWWGATAGIRTHDLRISQTLTIVYYISLTYLYLNTNIWKVKMYYSVNRI